MKKRMLRNTTKAKVEHAIDAMAPGVAEQLAGKAKAEIGEGEARLGVLTGHPDIARAGRQLEAERTQKVDPKKILAIDIGGTHVKVKCSTGDEVRKAVSGLEMTADKMVAAVKEMTQDWQYDVTSMGYPGPVLHDKIVSEPHNLGPGWVRFDFAEAFGKPVKIINDAAMQALGSYEGGRMLFLGLGTGLGTVLIVDGVMQPLEMGHLPYKKGRAYEDYVGRAGLERLGKQRWRKEVAQVITELSAAMEPDYVVIGGGNAKYLKEMPANCRLGANANAFEGGFRMWADAANRD